MKNSFVFVLILLIGVIVVGSAQTGTVRGNIYEKESGSPVIYCNVQLAGTKFGTTTAVSYTHLDVYKRQPPSRLDVRQQSMAVFPPPSTITLFPILCVCSKATLANHSIPTWIFAFPSSLPGMIKSLPLGAPVPTNTAS